MKHRSPAAPLLLPVVTFGIYALVWFVKSKDELNALVSPKIPTAWLLIVPIANWFWFWNFAKSVSTYTGGKSSQTSTFLLLLLLSSIGAAIVQSGLNAVTEGAPAKVAA